MPFDLDPSFVTADTPDVRAIMVYSTFDPTDRQIVDLSYVHGRTVAEYLGDLPEGVDYAVSAAGRVLDSSEWVTTTLNPGDVVVVTVIPNKGIGTILALVAMVVLAVAAPELAPLLLGPGGTLLGLSAAASVALVSGAITAVGGLLINGVMALTAKSANPTTAASSTSTTYGIDGAKNSTDENSVVPVIYGTMRVGGNLVNIFSENGTDATTQRLFLQAVVSEGPIDGISDFEINGQAAANFSLIETQVRTGESTQAPMNWFAETIRPINIQAKLTQSPYSYTTSDEVDRLRFDLAFPQGIFQMDTKSGAVNKNTVPLAIQYRKQGDTSGWTGLQQGPAWFEIDSSSVNTVSVATGLRLTIEVDGADGQATSAYDVQARIKAPGTVTDNGLPYTGTSHKLGSGAAIGTDMTVFGEDTGNIANVLTLDASGNTVFVASKVVKVFEINNLQSANYDFDAVGGTITRVEIYASNSLAITETFQGTYRRSITTPPLERAIYDVQIWRTNEQNTSEYFGDEVDLIDINEIADDVINYNNTAYYGVMCGIGSDLTSQPTVTALVRGKRVNIYDRTGNVIETRYSDSPADIALDVLLGARNRYAIPLSQIDFVSFDEWRTFCATQGFVFNGIFDTVSNIWDTLQTICRIGRASPTRQGMKWGIVMEAAADPVMMFTQDSIVQGTLQLTWTGRKDRANLIEVQYADASDSYTQKSVFALDDTYVVQGDALVQSTISLIGVTDKAAALREANFQLNLNRYLTQSAQFDVAYQAMGCAVGDVIQVQHDMPAWGYAAQITAIDVTQPWTHFTMDSPIQDWNEGDWRIMMLESAENFASAHITSVSGVQIQLDALAAPINAAGIYGPDEINANANLDATYLTNGMATASRLLLNGVDYDIVDKTDVAGQWVITLDRAPDTSGGNTVQIFRTNLALTGSVTLSEPSANGTQDVAVKGWDVTIGRFQPGMRILLGRANKVGKPFRITKISYKDDHTRTINAMEYNASVYTENPVPPVDLSNLTLDPYQVSNLTGQVNHDVTQGGALQYHIDLSWVRPLGDPRVYQGAKVYAGVNSSTLTQVGDVPNPGSTFSLPVNLGDKVILKVVAYTQTGVSANYNSAPMVAFTVSATATLPDAPASTSLTATGGIRLIALSWNEVQQDYVKGYQIAESATADITKSYQVFSGSGDSYIRSGLTPNATYYYWIRSVSSAGTYSAWSGPVAGTVSAILYSDLSEAIANTAKYAQSLVNSIGTPIDVESLPDPAGYQTGQVVFNEADTKLYKKNDAGQWEAVIPAVNVPAVTDAGSVDITLTSDQITLLQQAEAGGDLTDDQKKQISDAVSSGKMALSALSDFLAIASNLTNTDLSNLNLSTIAGTLTSDQIASLDATKVAGQLTSDQIAALAANKITGTLSSDQVATITAGQITGQLSQDQIASLLATQISGQLTAEQIASIAANQITGSITEDQIASIAASQITGQLTSDQISSLLASQIAGQLSDDQIAALAANKITGTLTADQIASIAANQITGQLTADQIGEIDAAKLSGQIAADALKQAPSNNLIWDGNGQTVGGWNLSGGSVSYTPVSSSSTWGLNGSGSFKISISANLTTSNFNGVYWTPDNLNGIAVQAGTYLECQVLGCADADGAGAFLYFDFLDVNGNLVAGFDNSNSIPLPHSSAGNALSDYVQISRMAVEVPSGAVTGRLNVFVTGNAGTNFYFTHALMGLSTATASIPMNWVNGARPLVDASSVLGQLTSDQVASIDAAKVAGTLTDAQLSTISATKVSGQLSDTQLATISAAKITGTIVAGQIASITADQISTQLTSAQIASLDATKLAGTLTDDQLTGLSANKLIGSIVAGQIASITSAQISGQLTSDQIASIDSAKLSGQIAANKLAQAPSNNLIWDGCGQTTGGWQKAGEGEMSIAAAGTNWGLGADGSFSLHIDANEQTGTWDGAVWQPTGTYGIAVEPGTYLEAQLLACSDTAGAGIYLYFDWLDSNNNIVAGYSGQAATPIAQASSGKLISDYTPISFMNQIVPAGASYARLNIFVTGQSGSTYYLSRVLVGQSTATATVPMTWVNGARPLVQSSAILGQLTDDQLAAISAAKVAGQLSDSQVASISSTKLIGSIVAGQIASVGAATITGTLTNAQIGELDAAKLTGSITTTQISDNAISTAKISAGAITTATLAAGAVTADTIASNAITSAKISAGAVTTEALTADAVTAEKIAAGAVSADSIAANTITAAQIAAGAITATEISGATITGDKLVANTITAGQIASQTITSAEIAAGTITAAQISAGSITANEIATGSLTASTLAAGTITGDKIAATTISAGNIVSGTITTTQIAAGTITATNIAAEAITADTIAANAITTAKLAAGAVTANTIAANTITGDKIQANSVNADRIVANSITAGQLAANSVTAAAISAGTITATELAAGSITAEKLSIGSPSNIIQNSTFALTVDPWTNASINVDNVKVVAASSIGTAVLPGGAAILSGTTNNSAILDVYCQDHLVVVPGQRVCAQALFNVTSGYGQLYFTFLDVTGKDIGGGAFGNRVTTGGVPNDSATYTKSAAFANAPANAVSVSLTLRIGADTSGVSMLTYVTQVALGTVSSNVTTAPDWVPGGVTQINGGQITANTITTKQLAAASVTADVIAAGAITAGKLAADSVTAASIAAGTITGTLISGQTITADNLAANTITAGQIAAETITGNKIAAQTISASNLVANTITAGQIASQTITASEIATGTLTATQIKAGTITSNEISANTITGNNIAGQTITGTNIAGQTITATNIAADTITANEIKAGTITATELAAGSITAEKLAIGNPNNVIWNSTFTGGTGGWAYDASITPAFGTTAQSNDGYYAATITVAANSSIDILTWSPAGANGFNFNTAVSCIGNDWWEAQALVALPSSLQAQLFLVANSLTNQFVNGGGANLQGSYTGAALNGPSDFVRVVNKTHLNGAAGYCGLLLRIANNTGNAVTATVYVTRTLLSKTTENADTLSWAPGGATTINGGQIQTGTVTAGQIAANAITATKILASTITGDKIAANTINTTNLVAGAITSDTIASGAITTEKLSAGAVTAQTIAAGAITAEKLSVGSTSNVIWNSCGAQTASGWVVGDSGNVSNIIAPRVGLVTLAMGGLEAEANQTGGGAYVQWNWSSDLDVVPGQKVQAQARVCADAGMGARVEIHWLDASRNTLSITDGNTVFGGDNTKLSGYPLTSAVDAAPANAYFARFKIVSIDVGNTGHASLRWTMTSFGFASANATTVSDWTPGGVTQIDGGQITTNSISAEKIVAASITGDKIAAQTINTNNLVAEAITTDLIAANAITGTKISAQAITARELAVGSVTAEKLAIASPSNIIWNSCCSLNTVGWDNYWNSNASNISIITRGASDSKYIPGVGSGGVLATWNSAGSGGVEIWWTTAMSVVAGQYYEAQTLAACLSSAIATIILRFFDANGAETGQVQSTTYAPHLGFVPTKEADFTKLWAWGQAPANSVTAILILHIDADSTSSETTFDVAFSKAALGSSVANATAPAPWVPGGVTEIQGGQITTGSITANAIAANTISADKLVTNSITTTQIAAGSVNADRLVANSITAGQIAANTITAGQIDASSITAAVLTAGSITAKMLTVGSPNNLIANSTFDPTGPGVAGWSSYSYNNAGSVALYPEAYGSFTDLWMLVSGDIPNGGGFAVNSTWMPASGGTTYCGSAYFQTFGGLEARVEVYCYDASGNQLAEFNGNWVSGGDYGAADKMLRSYVFGVAPSNTTSINLRLAVNNGTGSTQSNTGGHAALCCLGTVPVNATQPPDWTAGGTTVIDGSMIKTGTLAADKIAANSIGANQIAAGSITATQIATGTITATNMVASTITGDKIAGSTITGGNIAGTTITAANLAAGSVTTEKLTVGTGANVIWNSSPSNTLDGWGSGRGSGSFTFALNNQYGMVGELGIFLQVPDQMNRGNEVTCYWHGDATDGKRALPVSYAQGQRVHFSVYVACGNSAYISMGINFYDADGNQINGDGIDHCTNLPGNSENIQSSSPPQSLGWFDGYQRIGLMFDVPSQASYALPVIYLGGVNGSAYQPYVGIMRTMFGYTNKTVTEIPEWSPGGVTAITGNVIKTGTLSADRIQANSITANQIAAQTITGNNIAAQTIDASNLKANTITAGQIQAGAIGANEIAAGAIHAHQLAGDELIVSNAQIGSLVVGTSNIIDNSVTIYGHVNNDSTSGQAGSISFNITADHDGYGIVSATVVIIDDQGNRSYPLYAQITGSGVDSAQAYFNSGSASISAPTSFSAGALNFGVSYTNAGWKSDSTATASVQVVLLARYSK